MRGRLIAAVAAVLLLAGCSGAPAAVEEPAPSPTEAATTETPTPTPTKEQATAAQFASVVAGAEEAIREAEEMAIECRTLYALGDDEDPTDHANTLVCYMTEATAGLAASTAVMKLEALGEPPAEVATLVEDTIEAFGALADADMNGACGTGPEEEDEGDCTSATGQQMGAYYDAISVLDQWKPWL